MLIHKSPSVSTSIVFFYSFILHFVFKSQQRTLLAVPLSKFLKDFYSPLGFRSSEENVVHSFLSRLYVYYFLILSKNKYSRPLLDIVESKTAISISVIVVVVVASKMHVDFGLIQHLLHFHLFLFKSLESFLELWTQSVEIWDCICLAHLTRHVFTVLLPPCLPFLICTSADRLNGFKYI